MNLYVRYFDHEMLATNLDEVASFLASIREIKVDDTALDRIASYAETDGNYPFRLKVSYSNYVLFLKTEAKDMDEFKRMEKMRKQQNEDRMSMADKRRTQLEMYSEKAEGWYESSVTFKRVVLNPETGKCQYVDTRFRARLKATCVLDCYNRMIDHLHNRQDVDQRSQFPSIKSPNFECVYLDAVEDNADDGQNERPATSNTSDNAPSSANEGSTDSVAETSEA